MKLQIKQIAGGAVLLAIAILMMPATTVSAANGTNEESYISLFADGGGTVFSGYGDADKVSGVTYDKATNTLTLKNYKQSMAELSLKDMGDDFTIKVLGTNEIGCINSQTEKWGGSIRFTGTGTLTVNQKFHATNAIYVYGRGIHTDVTSESGVTLNLYKGNEEESNAIYVEGKDKNAISISGIPNSSYTNDKAKNEQELEYCSIPITVSGCTLESDTNEYAVVEVCSQYCFYEPTGESIDGIPYMKQSDREWVPIEGTKGITLGDSYQAFVDNSCYYCNVVKKDGTTYVVNRDWENDNYVFYQVIGKLPDESASAVVSVEEYPCRIYGDTLPGGYTYVTVKNYPTRLSSDLVMSKKQTVKKTSVSKLSAAKKGFTVTWKKVSNAKGYEVRYATSSAMKNAKTKTVASSKNSVKISNLKTKTKYYVQVRAYTKDSSGKKIYADWSAKKTVKTK